jgi:hypothetical protein
LIGPPAAPLNKNQVSLGPLIRSKDVALIPSETRVALFALNLQMESVLLRGVLRSKPSKHRWVATLDIDWVYNSMPPVPGQIFPQEPLAPVRRFETAI